MTESARIILDPQVLAGKPIVRGSRLSVEFVVGLRVRMRLLVPD